MGLSLQQIKEVIQNPIQQKQIDEAKKLQSRLSFHLEETVNIPTQNDAFNEWLRWVNLTLNNDKKYDLFKRLLKSPLDTVDFSNSIFSQYKKVFKTANPKRIFNFNNLDNRGDFAEFLKKYEKFWETKGFEEFMTRICSFVVIDTPEKQESTLPEPYFYFLNIYSVLAADVDYKANVNWIIFYVEEDLCVYVDYEKYIFIKKNDKDELKKDREIVHNYGFTPVRQFWTTNLNESNRFTKKSPIAKELGKLDHLLFTETAKEDAQLYTKFPIIWEYEQKEDHHTGGWVEPSNYVENSDGSSAYAGYGGYSGDARYDGYNWQQNKKTVGNESVFRGPGTTLIKPLPDSENPDLGEPAGFVSNDISSLEFINTDVQNRQDNIWLNAVGSPRVAQLNQAMNEDQVHSQFEAQENILNEIKENFEMIEKWTLESLAKIRYGTDEVLNFIIDYGDKYFLKSLDTLEKELTSAKATGMPESFIIDIIQQMIETRYKNDPQELERNKLLLHLEPFPSRGIEEIIEINSKFALPSNTLNKKLEFNSLIKRFERENGALELYRPDATFMNRVDSINDILDGYIEPNNDAQTLIEGEQ